MLSHPLWITEEKCCLKKKNTYIFQWFCRWRIGGLIKSQPIVIIEKTVKWHSHYGHQTREMVQKTIDNQEVLGTGGLITSRPAHFSLLPVNGIVTYLVTKPAQLPPSSYLIWIKGQWLRGLQNNSVKVMDTCGQQSSVDGIEVTFMHINSYLTLFSYIFI